MGLSQGIPPGTNASMLLTIILIIRIAALAALGFFHYQKTGSLLSYLPKLSSLSSLKSSENGNGVTFRSGDDVNMDIRVTGLGPESAIDRLLGMREHFATDIRKPPIIFGNLMYASKDTTITAAQPTTTPVTESGTVYNKNYGSPINPAEQGSDTKPTPSSPDETQLTK